MTPEPLADGGHGGGEQPGGGLEAALASGLDQLEAMVKGIFHLTHQIEIRGHDSDILAAARRPALPSILPAPTKGEPTASQIMCPFWSTKRASIRASQVCQLGLIVETLPFRIQLR